MSVDRRLEEIRSNFVKLCKALGGRPYEEIRDNYFILGCSIAEGADIEFVIEKMKRSML